MEIVYRGQTSAATMLDLSLSGILVTDLDLPVKIGEQVTVTIETDEVSATLAGSVVRTVEDCAIGIHFPESFREGEFDPPARLSRIHRSLEQAWLKLRKESKR